MINPGTTSDSNYSEMYLAANSTVTTIVAEDEWQALIILLEGEDNGFTYQAGIEGVIASVADAGGGDVTIADVGHGLDAGDMITINGCTNANYNGIFEVKTAATDTFTVTATWDSTDTGSWQRGSNLTCDVAGKYRGIWQATGQSADANQVLWFSPCLNTTAAVKAKSTRKFSNADAGSFGGTALMNIAVGDKIHFIVQNTTSDGDLTIDTMNLNLARL